MQELLTIVDHCHPRGGNRMHSSVWRPVPHQRPARGTAVYPFLNRYRLGWNWELLQRSSGSKAIHSETIVRWQAWFYPVTPKENGSMCSSNQALARGFCPEALQVSKPQLPVYQTRRNCSTSNSFSLFGIQNGLRGLSLADSNLDKKPPTGPLASAVHPPDTSCTPAA